MAVQLGVWVQATGSGNTYQTHRQPLTLGELVPTTHLSEKIGSKRILVTPPSYGSWRYTEACPSHMNRGALYSGFNGEKSG